LGVSVIWRVFALRGRTCWRCGGFATDIDHVVAIADGGTDSLANLRPACARCNRGRR
jgi:5-methylcytosine-specific restriction endonuclease McrA